MFVTLCAGSILLIDAAGHAVSREEVPCYLQNTNSTLQLSPYLIFILTFFVRYFLHNVYHYIV